MKKAIIFDLDGTLWDATKEVELVWKNVAKEYNIEITKSQIQEIMGLTKDEIIEHLFGDNIELGEEFITRCQSEENKYLAKNGAHIFENTLSTIKELYKNYDLYIVSNCQADYLEAFFSYYDAKKYFKDYETAGNTGQSKEWNIKKVVQRNNIEDAIYVGDTEKDYLSTVNNNIKFVWAKYGFGTCKYYDDCIEDISDLTY